METTAAINAEREVPLSYKTLLTIFSRIEAKGWVTHVIDGRAYRYKAALNESQWLEQHARAAARAMLERYGDLALGGIVDEAASDPKALARLSELVSAARV
jgi:predicted transcriptional regulator